MDRNLTLISSLIQANKNRTEQIPAWAKAENLHYCDFLNDRSKEYKKSHNVSSLKRTIAETLRGFANKLDPIQLSSEQAQM